ncbi:MAG: nitroreductase family protein [Chitinivibrionia bacterium]|nr:nitroreductase family protein [Chitinivibrionia bacterium]
METIETIKTRKSVRKFGDKDISQTDIAALKEALLYSPTSRNRDTWNFYFVHTPALLQKLAHCKEDGSALINGAKLAVVICGDENICDVWIEDASISSIILQLAAHSLRLGSCWVQVRGRNHNNDTTAEKYVQELLNIPANHRVLSIVALGYSAETQFPRENKKLRFDKITDIR